jgi:hypothetical protein
MDSPDIINLNKNPLDYPGITGEIVVTWNFFQKYLQKIKYVADVSYDSNKRLKDTQKIISDYNEKIETKTITTSNNTPLSEIYWQYLKPITQDNIKAAQTFHNKNDSRVKIDGWVGSQTSQLIYPIPLVEFTFLKSKNTKKDSYLTINSTEESDIKIPYRNSGYLPVVWGNKRFVVSAQVYTDYTKKKLSPPYSSFYLYDENTYKDTLQEIPSDFTEWYTVGQNTEITKNAAQIELQRQADSVKAKVSETTTNIKLKINTAKTAVTTKL